MHAHAAILHRYSSESTCSCVTIQYLVDIRRKATVEHLHSSMRAKVKHLQFDMCCKKKQ